MGSSPIMSGTVFIRPQSTGLSGLGKCYESYCKLQPKLKTVSKFTGAQTKWAKAHLVCLARESYWQSCERHPQL